MTLDCTADDDALAFDLQMTIGDTPGRPLGAVQNGLLTLKRNDLPARLQSIPLEAANVERSRLMLGGIDLQLVRRLDPAHEIAFRIQTRDINHEQTDYAGVYEFRLIQRPNAHDRAGMVVRGKATCSLGP